MWLFPETVFLYSGKAEDLWTNIHAGRFYDNEWFLKITDIFVHGESAKVARKYFDLSFSSDFCQEEVLNQNREVNFRNQSLAVVSGQFPAASEGSELGKVGRTFRFDDAVFYLVNRPSDFLSINVTCETETGLSIEDLDFSIRLVVFKVRASD